LSDVLLSPDTLASVISARHVHLAMPLSRALAQALLPALAESGCTTSLDPGYQPAWLTDAANHDTWRAVDYLLPNEKEAELLSGGRGIPADFFAFARRLPLRNSVLKLGARGAMADAGGHVLEVRPPRVDAVDTTGSGDAFDAGFIDALLEGAAWEERLRRACICGALSTRMPGALGGLPDRQELWSVYEQTYGS
jgi:sugar/nucleoside kinase (ribokinase family)